MFYDDASYTKRDCDRQELIPYPLPFTTTVVLTAAFNKKAK
jgi:hypothetical protein